MNWLWRHLQSVHKFSQTPLFVNNHSPPPSINKYSKIYINTVYKRRKSNCILWLPPLHLKYFGGCFLGWRWVELKCVLKISGSPPLKMISDHLGGRKHVPLFKIINLTRIMRTYELYYWSLKCQEVIWSDYFHLISLCLINKTDLFFFQGWTCIIHPSDK